MRWILPLALTVSAFSHQLWMEREGDTLLLHYGHLKPAPGEERYVRYEPSWVKHVACYDAEGYQQKISVIHTYPLRIKGNCKVAVATLWEGYWTKTTEGLKKAAKDEVKEPIESWASYGYVKRLDLWVPKPIGQELEITPLDDFTKAKVGEKLTFLVTYRGRPLANVPVSYNGHVVGTTDDRGRINIRLKEKGLNVVETSLKEMGDGKKADYIIREATLVFEIH
ncbi:Nickel transport complex, NikM subunit, transmembrane [Thermocrinis albus DSM 14484]|uniref:Nickel transport complex, NikM subunit, transmembrane n=1 Tax=Thermocrinis albus (strain DSM 14484 / JCM 11386 / HI 11/12) TaxID=638303 RepID=D3SLQ4_THEAH|nr:DUF4198 domain-containing protein [Thermocrinis albus]ADC89684.1 Nickel transport complex, NikM subunit, transmembrane [Thermocrinis albus DSM 14484]